MHTHTTHTPHTHHFGNSKLRSVGSLATSLKTGERGNLERGQKTSSNQVAVIEARKLPDTARSCSEMYTHHHHRGYNFVSNLSFFFLTTKNTTVTYC